jgi:hypothetical protein
MSYDRWLTPLTPERPDEDRAIDLWVKLCLMERDPAVLNEPLPQALLELLDQAGTST